MALATFLVISHYGSGVVHDGEVSLLAAGLGRLGLDEAVGLAKMVVVQLVGKGLVGGLGEHRLFLQDGQDTHGLIQNSNVVELRCQPSAVQFKQDKVACFLFHTILTVFYLHIFKTTFRYSLM